MIGISVYDTTSHQCLRRGFSVLDCLLTDIKQVREASNPHRRVELRCRDPWEPKDEIGDRFTRLGIRTCGAGMQGPAESGAGST